MAEGAEPLIFRVKRSLPATRLGLCDGCGCRRPCRVRQHYDATIAGRSLHSVWVVMSARSVVLCDLCASLREDAFVTIAQRATNSGDEPTHDRTALTCSGRRGGPAVSYNGGMPYPEQFIAPMRAELTRLGVQELRNAADVDHAVQSPGTVMIIVNSVCGCAAGKARPGVALALQHARRPELVGTVFAGADIDATDRAREYFAPYLPSSPSIALMRDGKLLYMLERRDIENRDAAAIAAKLTAAFDEHCQTATSVG